MSKEYGAHKNRLENCTIAEAYERHYSGRVSEFLRDVGDIDVSGIPDPHLPLWGTSYESAPLRLAFIGQDTRGWGRMSDFRTAAERRTSDALFAHADVFRDLLFTSWTTNFGTSFWDTVLQLLAVFHQLPDWRALKRRERDDLLQTFMWAETNAVELWSSTPSSSGAAVESWQRCKGAAERHFDLFSSILKVFQPHVAVILNWTVRDEYWDVPFERRRIGERVDYGLLPSHETHVFHIAHPTWLRSLSSPKRRGTFDAISRQWSSLAAAP